MLFSFENDLCNFWPRLIIMGVVGIIFMIEGIWIKKSNTDTEEEEEKDDEFDFL